MWIDREFSICIFIQHSFQSQKFSKIRFQVPEWFTVENLGKMIVAENDDTSFTPVPRHFLEMSRIFLYHFKDDVVDGDQVFEKILNCLIHIRMIHTITTYI